jgi:DNA polymerase-1
MSVSLPNIRKLFLPDPGYTMFDVDLAGADAQVVAWEAEDEDLKSAFRAGLDVHSFNAETVMGTRFSSLLKDDPVRYKLRSQSKQAVHGTNYGASARTLAQILGWTIHETELFQQKWFSAHPGIKAWHHRIELALRTNRTVHNAFGYRRIYFDRVDALLPQALAWVPQSTVALVCFRGALTVRRNLPHVQLLVQVHDSLVGQIPTHMLGTTLPQLRHHLHNAVPYPDPLTIRWGLSLSEKSWGDCKDAEWPEEKIPA